MPIMYFMLNNSLFAKAKQKIHLKMCTERHSIKITFDMSFSSLKLE